ncbi:unnamed protein product [Moneuplotes crassus]|uniref:TLC domain-containing protein n=1 Tax=Euplotes crassus TaxID=5936 RepID=A0AAD1XF28_EUPCR|nr:unnamed protein product [Moneuplotes crassus]
MLTEIMSWYAFFTCCVGLSAKFITAPLRKEDGKHVEMSKKAKTYQYHDWVSLLYSVLLIGLFAMIYKDHGFELNRPGTEIDRHIMILGVAWYTFDLIIKAYAGIINSFVTAHHIFTVLSMLGCYIRNETHAFGAVALFINDASMICFVLKRTFERMNLELDDDRFKINFISLTISFVITRVWGNFWLLYTYAVSIGNNPLIIILNSPTVAFGAIISIKFLSKLWKHIPEWSSNPERVEEMALWKNVRVMFKTYNSRGMLKKLVDCAIYIVSVLTPIALSIYFSYSIGVSEDN